jgi:peptide/nickel transport system permease protein
VGSFVDYTSFDKTSLLLPPSIFHIFGTDILGRDIFARVIKGSQYSIIIALISSFVATSVGFIVGVTSAMFKGLIDRGVVISIDLFLSFPTLFLLLTLISYTEASVLIIIFILSLTSWMGIARLIRSEAYGIDRRPYIKILKLAKVSKSKIIIKYYLPILLPIFIVNFVLGISGSMLAESSLGFLGLGVTAPDITLGTILGDGKMVMDIAWWATFFPGLFIFMITWSLINISDYIQNRLNSKEKHI